MLEENEGLQGKKKKKLFFSFSLKLPACISLPRSVTVLCVTPQYSSEVFREAKRYTVLL